ncbi:MAG: hypothetical protein E7Z81_04645 [Methanobrevibacter sp.]|jgi:hypothetical protein|uniref:hypothetical protein n=1 Tax=Methanobrevibacter sp. TaxID=66852 RepID=UPI0025CE1A11|nr:hypothetical protein [Methanobrevibacter sp.]MBE6497549.1 hypothetical protein [Methanobrevibacter sp.]
MENKHIIIILALVIVILALAMGILFLQQNSHEQTNVEINQSDESVSESSSSPDTITVELPEFDKTYIGTSGEYRVEASKWMGGSVGGFDIHLYKNGQSVYKDSYMTRAYFYMDGEWKWSEWGNGQDGYKDSHRYPVSNGVEIQKIEVKF